MQALLEEVAELDGEALGQLGDLGVQDGLRHLDAVVVLVERVAARGALHQHQAEAPDVAGVAVGQVADALGGHVPARLWPQHRRGFTNQ